MNQGRVADDVVTVPKQLCIVDQHAPLIGKPLARPGHAFGHGLHEVGDRSLSVDGQCVEYGVDEGGPLDEEDMEAISIIDGERA